MVSRETRGNLSEIRVQIRDDRQAVRIDLPDDGALTMAEAVQLARDLIDAVTQCGHEVKMTVDVPRHRPSDAQIAVAVARIGHLRRSMDAKPWNDARTNQEFVQRVLEACL